MISESNESVIIVAGGSGKRMCSEIPKQFLLLKGLPILMRTISAFYDYNPRIQLIVVLPEDQIGEWNSLLEKYNFRIGHEVVSGGKERFFSVLNGLGLVKSGNTVAIHDGVRPLVSKETITRCFELAKQKGSAVPVIDVFESIRRVDESGNIAVNRQDFRLVQTPQVFEFQKITTAYKQSFSTIFTDDASVVEASGFAINLCNGNRENIKVTTPIDMAIAEALMKE